MTTCGGSRLGSGGRSRATTRNAIAFSSKVNFRLFVHVRNAAISTCPRPSRGLLLELKRVSVKPAQETIEDLHQQELAYEDEEKFGEVFKEELNKKLKGAKMDEGWDESVKWEDWEEPKRDGGATEKKTFEELFGDVNAGGDPPKRKAQYPPQAEEFKNPKFQEWERKREEKVKAKAKNIKEWKGVLRDQNGEEEVSVYTRGDAVAMILGEFWEWTGEDFSNLKFGLQQRLLNTDKKMFKTTEPDEFLSEFSLMWEMPIHIIDLRNTDKKATLTSALLVELEVDHREPNVQSFRISLPVEGKRYQSAVQPSLNQCLNDITNILPEHLLLKSCWSCAFSHYSPMGFSHFGGLGCFKTDESMRNQRSGKNIYSKWSKRDDDVQEQHLCETWAPREVKHKMPKSTDFDGKKWKFDFE